MCVEKSTDYLTSICFTYSDFNRTIESINAKHGTINKDCTLETEHMRTVMFGIWGLLNELQNKKLDEMDMSPLLLYYEVAGDAEKLNINMKWLLKRLDEIKDAITARDAANLLQSQKNTHVKEREVKEEELRLLLVQFKEMEIQVKEMENCVTEKDLIIEELDGEINSLTSKFQHLQTRPLLDGLM